MEDCQLFCKARKETKWNENLLPWVVKKKFTKFSRDPNAFREFPEFSKISEVSLAYERGTVLQEIHSYQGFLAFLWLLEILWDFADFPTIPDIGCLRLLGAPASLWALSIFTENFQEFLKKNSQATKCYRERFSKISQISEELFKILKVFRIREEPWFNIRHTLLMSNLFQITLVKIKYYTRAFIKH